MSLSAGNQVGSYVINDLIGKGSMGVVWSAFHKDLNNSVAIKAISNDLFFDPDFKLRIKDEARRHVRLRHPNIVNVLDVFDTDGETCIVMQMVEGQSLSSLLEKKQNRRLEFEEAIPIFKDILQALDYAHRQAVVHRDVKPSNVMVDQNSRALLVDFGLALAASEERRTRTGMSIGTPAYMSPEHITRPKSINHLSDIYSVGCVFYEMLTGRPPFLQGENGVGDSDIAIMQAHVNVKPLPPKTRVASVPSYLNELIMEALEKDPNNRIPGCQEFLRLLEEADKNRSADAMHAAQKWRSASLKKLLWGIGFAVIALLALVFLFVR